jgi:hypothetical protein
VPLARSRERGYDDAVHRSRAFLIVIFPALLAFGAQQNGIGKVIAGDAQQAREAETDLQEHPDNLQERGALMSFYENHRDEAGFTKQLLWMVDHHPEAPVATMKFYPAPPGTGSKEDHEHIQAAWEKALTTHSASPEVLFHAGLFLEEDNPIRALTLFHQAQDLTTDPKLRAPYFDAIARVYAAAVMRDLHANDPRFQMRRSFDPATASALRAELESSTDPALLSKAGTSLVEMREDAVGLGYLQKAIDLDGSNPAWRAALESAKVEPIRRQNFHTLTEVSRAVGEQ